MSPPQLKDSSLNFFAAWEAPALREFNLTFNCVFAEVGEGWRPLLDWTQVPQPHGLNCYGLAGRAGTKQLLFCQTPLDKYSTFNNKLCKPNAKQFLASKLDFPFFKKWGKVQVISVLLGKTKIKINKLHQATCYLNQSQLQFRFWSSVGVTSGHVYLAVLLRVRLGWGKGSRHTAVKKAIPGANASWLSGVNGYGLAFPLSWLLTCLLCRRYCDEHKNSWPESWWGLGALRETDRGNTDWILTWRSGCCRAPPMGQPAESGPEDLLSGVTDIWNRAGEKHFLIQAQVTPAACLSQRCEGIALVVGTRSKEGRLPALHLAHNGSPVGRS